MLYVESADVGQHKVEHDDVGRFEIELSQRVKPIGRLTDEISRKGQGGPEGGAQVVVVLDDENCPALEGLNVRHNRYIQAIFSLSPEPSIASLNPAGLKKCHLVGTWGRNFDETNEKGVPRTAG